MQEFNYQSKLFFKNQYKKDKRTGLWVLPPEGTSAFDDMVAEEEDKCINGVNINGFHLYGTLYYFINHSYLDYTQMNPLTGREDTVIGLPKLRDNEWEIHTEYNSCRQAGEGFILGGCRQISKTSTEVCLTMHELNFFQNSEVLALFSTKKDKHSFTKKLKTAVQYNTPFLTIPSIDKDFSKELIRFGEKLQNNEDFEFSKIFIYLTDEGRATEVGAGKTPTLYFLDEIAKEDFLKVNEGVLPAIRSQIPGQVDRLKAGVMYTFTGGEAEKAGDAQTMYYDPETYHCRAYDSDKTGYFMSGLYRTNLKRQTTFGQYLKSKGIILDNEELASEPFLEVDIEAANIQLDLEEAKALAKSKTAYIKRRTYAPRKKSDMFGTGKVNIFSEFLPDLEKLYHYLTHESPSPEIIEFKKVDGEVVKETSNKHIFTDFPLSNIQKENTITGISMYAKPKIGVNGELLVQGADVFNTISTSESVSLGSWYIMQKDSDNINDPWNSRIIMGYNGRDGITNLRNSLLYSLQYCGGQTGNITLLHEAADDNLTQWFIQINKGYLLKDTYSLNREINPKTKATNIKGCRATPNTQEFYLRAIKDYLGEELGDGRLGLWRIPCPYLVKQLMTFNGDLNPMDAIVAFGHALMNLNSTKRYGQVKAAEEDTGPVKKKVVVQRSLFGSGVSRKSATKRRSVI
jgi:hypothetical protein